MELELEEFKNEIEEKFAKSELRLFTFPRKRERMFKTCDKRLPDESPLSAGKP